MEPEYRAWGTFTMFADPDGNEFGLTSNLSRHSVMQRIPPTALAHQSRFCATPRPVTARYAPFQEADHGPLAHMGMSVGRSEWCERWCSGAADGQRWHPFLRRDATGHELCTSCRHQQRGRDSGPWLLRKPVAECVVAEEGHDANLAIETL
jgi:hypothetical protein